MNINKSYNFQRTCFGWLVYRSPTYSPLLRFSSQMPFLFRIIANASFERHGFKCKEISERFPSFSDKTMATTPTNNGNFERGSMLHTICYPKYLGPFGNYSFIVISVPKNLGEDMDKWPKSRNDPKHLSMRLVRNLPDERPLNVILDDHFRSDPSHTPSSLELKQKQRIKSNDCEIPVSFCPTDVIILLPDRAFCRLLRLLSQKDVRKLRQVSRKINARIKAIYVFNATLNEQNVQRKWTTGIQLPWCVDSGKQVCNEIQYLRVGSLTRAFKEDLTVVGTTIKEIELCAPLSKRNLQHIMKACKQCATLRIHAIIFREYENPCSCVGKSMRKPKIKLNHLRKLYIIFDVPLLTSSKLSSIGIKINLMKNGPYNDTELKPPDMGENISGKDSGDSVCEIYFLPKTTRNSKSDSLNCKEGTIGMEPLKTWVVDDDTMDLHGRPECLRKLSYFAMVNTANLCQIRISFNQAHPPIIPSLVKCSKHIHHPCFYPQRRKYLTGPFNGTFLTYVSSKEKIVIPYNPIGNMDRNVSMSYAEAANTLVPQVPQSICS